MRRIFILLAISLTLNALHSGVFAQAGGDLSIEKIEAPEPSVEPGFLPFSKAQPTDETKSPHLNIPSVDFSVPDTKLEKYGTKQGRHGKLLPFNRRTPPWFFRIGDWPFKTEDQIIRDRILWLIH